MAKLQQKGGIDPSIFTDIDMSFQYMEEMERIVPLRELSINHTPVVDMFSTPHNVILEIELPGVRQEEIDVSILHNTITVRALKYDCFDDKKINFVCMERSFGRFFRVIDIPCPVDTTRIKAVYKNGLLILTLLKIADKRGVPKKICVES